MDRKIDDNSNSGGERSDSAGHISRDGVTGPWQRGGVTRRRTGRLPQESLVCNLGPILDISIGGMRVLSRTPHRGTVNIQFSDYTLPERLDATVTWSKRTGLFSREIGLRFENVTPRLCVVLTQIASLHRYRRAI
jgi:hypothetical protein